MKARKNRPLALFMAMLVVFGLATTAFAVGGTDDAPETAAEDAQTEPGAENEEAGESADNADIEPTEPGETEAPLEGEDADRESSKDPTEDLPDEPVEDPDEGMTSPEEMEGTEDVEQTEEPNEDSETVADSDLPDPILGYDPLEPDNPYPYGIPVDVFFPEGFFEALANGALTIAADQGSIPDEMWDNSILRALAYTGYDVQKKKDNGWLYVSDYIAGALSRNAPEILSKIGYGSGSNGDEMVADPSTVTGLAPDISYFEKKGLVCASFVAYYLCNYLPNIEGVDTSAIYDKVMEMGGGNMKIVSAWRKGLTALAEEPGGGVTKYTNASTAYANLVPGDVIAYKNDSGTWTHVAIYAGTYKLLTKSGASAGTYHFTIHVGNSRGPEISTAEYMATAEGEKASTPAEWYHIEFNTTPTPDVPKGDLTVSKTVTGTAGDTSKYFHFKVVLNGTGINGTFGSMTFTNGVAEFDLKHGESKTAAGLPAGVTYTVTESNNDGYTVSSTGASGTIPANSTAYARFTNSKDEEIPPPPEEPDPGYGRIRKVTNTGRNLGGWSIGIYTDSNCTQPVAGSPFTMPSSGVLDVELEPGAYWCRELSSGDPFWRCDTSVQKLIIGSGEVSTVTFSNTHYGLGKIVKSMPDGGSAAGWSFDVYRKSDNAFMGSYTTGADGTVLTDYLLPGDYVVYENIPEDSYYYCESANPQTVTVTAGGIAAVTFVNRLRPGKIDVLKVDTTNTPRAGAEFLLEWSEDGVTWSPVFYSENVVKGGCSSHGLVNGARITGSDGKISFEGLHPELLYRLSETKAPDGLQMLTGYAYEGTLPLSNDLTVSLRVVNAPVFTLPETGGNAFSYLPVMMGLCFGLCAVMLVSTIRKRRVD